MAFELYGMLAGNVSHMTGENVKPAYGGDEEAFLTKVVSPIYDVIAKVFKHFIRFILIQKFCILVMSLLRLFHRKLPGAKWGNQNIPNGEIMTI